MPSGQAAPARRRADDPAAFGRAADRHPRGVALLRAVTVAALAGYVASFLLVPRQGGEPVPLLDAWLYNAINLVAAALCGARVALVRAERPAWAFLALALVSTALGDLSWEVFIRGLDPQPYPSVADAFWLAFYPLAYVALVLLVRGRVAGFQRSVWLDGVIGGLGAASLAAALVFGPVLEATAGDPVTVAINLAYPTADLLLVTLAVGTLALTGWRPDRMWGLLVGSFGVWVVADTIFLLQAAAGTYGPGTPLEALWPAGSVLMALAAWEAPEEGRRRRFEGASVLAVPALFALAALALLVHDRFPFLFGARGTSEVAVALAAGTVLAALARMVVSFREVRTLAETRRQALTDELTGLGNRRLLYGRLGAALAGPESAGALALLLIDLDRFKEVNDALGHHVGDELLQRLGPRLAGGLRSRDVLARIGGDEFAIVLPATDAAGAMGAGRRILAALREPFTLDDVTVHIDASIGIVLSPDHGREANTLLRRADMAMYRAKAMRSGCELYHPEQDLYTRDRLELLAQLSVGIETGQLVVHYQPICELPSGRTVGVEALVRWAHPERGLLSPDAFLPLAEPTTLMRRLTRAVLEVALPQCRAWRDAGFPLRVSVNVSVTNLLDAEFPAEVARLLEWSRLPPEALCLEITEKTLMADPVRAQEVVARLHELGLRVAVDDFGTGYSSVAYLRQLRVDELKLDRSFAARVVESATDAAIARSTVELAHALGLRTVAEGIEDRAVWDELGRLGCDLAQGYYLSRPLPPRELTGWLRERHGEAAGEEASAEAAAGLSGSP